MKSMKAVVGLVCMASSVFAAQPKPGNAHWVGTWMCATVPAVKERNAPLVAAGIGVEDVTVRNVVHVSLGGHVIRVRVSNEQGTAPLTFGAVHVALSAMVEAPTDGRGSALDTTKPGTDHAVMFGGSPSVTVPAGKAVWSDPVAMELPALSSLAVSLFVPAQKLPVTGFHFIAESTNFVAKGNQAAATALPGASKLRSWVFLTGVDVDAPPDAWALAIIGDSISDGNISTVDANRRWTDDLARRLHANPKTADVAVLNAAVAGDRILYPQTGPSILDRFEHDVLQQDGVKYVILEGGENDISHTLATTGDGQDVKAPEIIAGIRKMAAMAHAHGVKFYGSTLTPSGGSKFHTDSTEVIRQAVNAWMRSQHELDGYVDFDKAVLDPAKPDTLRLEYGGDKSGHIHLFDVGYQAMADAVDLSKFE